MRGRCSVEHFLRQTLSHCSRSLSRPAQGRFPKIAMIFSPFPFLQTHLYRIPHAQGIFEDQQVYEMPARCCLLSVGSWEPLLLLFLHSCSLCVWQPTQLARDREPFPLLGAELERVAPLFVCPRQYCWTTYQRQGMQSLYSISDKEGILLRDDDSQYSSVSALEKVTSSRSQSRGNISVSRHKLGGVVMEWRCGKISNVENQRHFIQIMKLPTPKRVHSHLPHIYVTTPLNACLKSEVIDTF